MACFGFALGQKVRFRDEAKRGHNSVIKLALLTLVLASVPILGQDCRNIAHIGGEVIRGGVSTPHSGPLRRAEIRLYAGTTLIATAVTNDQGGFTFPLIAPTTFALVEPALGTEFADLSWYGRLLSSYRIVVSGWGNAWVQVDPEADRPFLPQHPGWSIFLYGNGCVGVGVTVG